MDVCPRRGDPSFPGWIITLWLKFAFNYTALRVIPCCGDKSPVGSLAHSLDSYCPGTTSPLVPTTHPVLPSTHLLDIRSRGGELVGAVRGAPGNTVGANVLSSGSVLSGVRGFTVVGFHSVRVATEDRRLPWERARL